MTIIRVIDNSLLYFFYRKKKNIIQKIVVHTCIFKFELKKYSSDYFKWKYNIPVGVIQTRTE